MSQPQRVSIEQIISAYRETGSVWKAGKKLGVCGQSVHERLKAVDHPMASAQWTEEEHAELALLAATCTISQIAERLGRPYYAVAIKMSRRGLANRYGNRQKRFIRRGTGFNKDFVIAKSKELKVFTGSLRQFSKMNALNIDTLVAALQKYVPEFWAEYSSSRDLGKAVCPYCEADYFPMSGKQKTCSRKCSETAKRDEKYFGGKRRKAVGLSEGICQLCNQQKDKGLSAHHVLGKQNDPENDCLVALCAGCHQLVGQLAGRRFVDNNEGWENLITLVMGRRMAEKASGYAGAYACVEMEYLTAEDLFEDDGSPEQTEVRVRQYEPLIGENDG